MALTMMDKQAARKDPSEWPATLREEFEREAGAPNGCVGSELVSETDKSGCGPSASRRASGSASIATCSTTSGPQ
jgi:hypothetical protein